MFFAAMHPGSSLLCPVAANVSVFVFQLQEQLVQKEKELQRREAEEELREEQREARDWERPAGEEEGDGECVTVYSPLNQM